jgi:hypothetical protein
MVACGPTMDFWLPSFDTLIGEHIITIVLAISVGAWTLLGFVWSEGVQVKRKLQRRIAEEDTTDIAVSPRTQLSLK